MPSLYVAPKRQGPSQYGACMWAVLLHNLQPAAQACQEEDRRTDQGAEGHLLGRRHHLHGYQVMLKANTSKQLA